MIGRIEFGPAVERDFDALEVLRKHERTVAHKDARFIREAEEKSLSEAVELLRALTYAAWRFHEDTGHDGESALSCDWICDEMRAAKRWLEGHGYELMAADSSESVTGGQDA